MHNLGGASDHREDVRGMFALAGFTDVTGTNGIDTAVLGAYAIALQNLEREYGAIGASENPVFTTGNGSAKAAVFYYDDNPSNQFMAINSDSMGSISKNLSEQRSSELSGWHAQTDGKITSQARYTISHEYGHMLSNALAAKQGMTASSFSTKAANEISSIARSVYGASKGSSVSTYGTHSAAELFAESFASYTSGSPNAYGKAIGDWLQNNTL